MTTDKKIISSSWPWALLVIPLVAVLAAVLLSPQSGPVAVAGAAPCDPGRAHDAGDFDRTIESGGLTRDYILHVPPSYTGDEAAPLVVLLHGLGDSAAGIANYTELPSKADEAGFILVMPQALSTDLLNITHWNIVLFPSEVGEPDDLTFIADMLNELESELCIDADRIFATGASNGAQMSSRLGCSLADRIAAIAPVAGVYFPPLSLDLPEPAGCPDMRSMPLLAFHGTSDTVIPFNGGQAGAGDFSFILRDIDDDIMPEWAAHNGCTSGPSTEQATENVQLVRYEGCNKDATLALYVIDGGGHVWPGAEDSKGPDVADEISANDLIWDFFLAHPMPAAQPASTPTPSLTPTPSPTSTATAPHLTAEVLPAVLPAAGAAGAGDPGIAGWLVAALTGAGAVTLAGATWFARRRLAS